ncbi:MAG: hypothetical protein BWY26_01444 [Elusimicrobia bacterium ADurb.Bin231]|nr:MAG: hypothetical protein BWY26_01444 [Elusimicrobia bacterium ADurb.Bin231]
MRYGGQKNMLNKKFYRLMTGIRKYCACRLIIVICYLLCLISAARSATPGTSGSQFLNVPIFARSAALGEAYTGCADEAGIMEYNPGGIGNIYVKEVWFSHLSYIENSSLQSFSLVLPYRKFVVGLNCRYHGSQEKEFDANGIETGDFKISDLSVMPAFAYRVTPELSCGVGIKGISQKLHDESGSSVAADMGVFYRFARQRVAAGVSLVNVGKGVKFIDERDPLPMTFKLGGSWELSTGNLILLEVLKPNDDTLKQRIGFEYHIIEPMWLRMGWKISGRKFEDYTGFTSGFGLRFGRFYLDYAFVPHSNLGSSHYVTTGLKFGSPLPLPKSKAIKIKREEDSDAAGEEDITPEQDTEDSDAEY